jgi:hypothetical protein
MFFFGGAYFVALYYLPIYFQSVHNASPIESGVRMLAFIIPLTIAAIVQGFALTKIGIVPLFWLVGGMLETVGAGLFYTMDADTPAGRWIGYQILVGFVAGWTFQVAMANAQIHAQPEDLSQATAIVNCKSTVHLFTEPCALTSYIVSVTIGGAFFISAAQCAFNNQLIRELARRLPEIDPAVVLATGATRIRQDFPASQVPIVLEAYMVGLKAVFAVMIAAYGISSLVSVFGSWERLDEEKLKAAGSGAA